MPSRKRLSATGVQERVFAELRALRNIAVEPDGFLGRVLNGFDCSSDAVTRAVETIYKEMFYSYSRDLDLDTNEKRTTLELRRLLELSEERVASLNYEVGLALYKKRFRDFCADGRVSLSENEQLQEIARFFELRTRDCKKAVSNQALAYYSFLLADAVKDHVLSHDEMGELALVAQRWGLTDKQLSTLSVPEKKDILLAALTAIKGNGAIEDEDRAYIHELTRYLNAPELLKPCMKDLELYAKIFEIRNGTLPEVDSGSLILERGERLHYKLPIIYQTTRSGKLKKRSGTLYVGGRKLRFVGLGRSHEVRYRNILRVAFKQLQFCRISLAVGSGGGGGDYCFTRKGDPGLLVELEEAINFLIRKARGLEAESGRDSAYVPIDIRSEVFYRDGGQCVMCGAKEYLEFDHIIPRSKGGATSVENLQILCRKCNSEKSDHI